MCTEHRINTEKLYFLTRETDNMDTEEEDISAIYINLINRLMHLPTFKWTSSFLYETIVRKKSLTKYFAFADK